MNLTNIESLFNKVINSSQYKREKKKNFDGKKFWQPIKNILSGSKWNASKWKNQSKKIYNKYMDLPEFYIDGHGNKKIIEENHFLIQTVRIPQQEKPSLKKIIQIALNIGQYQGYTGKKIKNNNINNFIMKKDSKILLKNILQKNEISQLKKLLK